MTICSQEEREAGRPYPRTCPTCKLGKCHKYGGTPLALIDGLRAELATARECIANLEADQAAKETAIGGLEFALEQAWASNVERDELIAKLRADIGARDRLLDDPVVNDIQDAAWNHARAALS